MENHDIRAMTVYSVQKAGMSAKSLEEINNVVYQLSKDSPHWIEQQRKDDQVNQRIARMLHDLHSLESSWKTLPYQTLISAQITMVFHSLRFLMYYNCSPMIFSSVFELTRIQQLFSIFHCDISATSSVTSTSTATATATSTASTAVTSSSPAAVVASATPLTTMMLTTMTPTTPSVTAPTASTTAPVPIAISSNPGLMQILSLFHPLLSSFITNICPIPPYSTQMSTKLQAMTFHIPPGFGAWSMCAHIDFDSFFASASLLKAPELVTKPIAVGGSAIISTSNYVARQYGVRSAQPTFIAKELCPELIMLPFDGTLYHTLIDRFVHPLFAQFDPHFSSSSLDEARLDMSYRYIFRAYPPCCHSLGVLQQQQQQQQQQQHHDFDNTVFQTLSANFIIPAQLNHNHLQQHGLSHDSYEMLPTPSHQRRENNADEVDDVSPHFLMMCIGPCVDCTTGDFNYTTYLSIFNLVWSTVHKYIEKNGHQTTTSPSTSTPQNLIFSTLTSSNLLHSHLNMLTPCTSCLLSDIYRQNIWFHFQPVSQHLAFFLLVRNISQFHNNESKTSSEDSEISTNLFIVDILHSQLKKNELQLITTQNFVSHLCHDFEQLIDPSDVVDSSPHIKSSSISWPLLSSFQTFSATYLNQSTCDLSSSVNSSLQNLSKASNPSENINVNTFEKFYSPASAATGSSEGSTIPAAYSTEIQPPSLDLISKTIVPHVNPNMNLIFLLVLPIKCHIIESIIQNIEQLHSSICSMSLDPVLSASWNPTNTKQDSSGGEAIVEPSPFKSHSIQAVLTDMLLLLLAFPQYDTPLWRHSLLLPTFRSSFLLSINEHCSSQLSNLASSLHRLDTLDQHFQILASTALTVHMSNQHYTLLFSQLAHFHHRWIHPELSSLSLLRYNVLLLARFIRCFLPYFTVDQWKLIQPSVISISSSRLVHDEGSSQQYDKDFWSKAEDIFFHQSQNASSHNITNEPNNDNTDEPHDNAPQDKFLLEHLVVNTNFDQTGDHKLAYATAPFSLDAMYQCTEPPIHLHQSIWRYGRPHRSSVLPLLISDISTEIRQYIYRATHITCSFGAAPTSTLAKICSDRHKPNGHAILPNHCLSVLAFISELPVRSIPGVGRVFEKLLNSLSLTVCGKLLNPVNMLRMQHVMGQVGFNWLSRASCGGSLCNSAQCDGDLIKAVGEMIFAAGDMSSTSLSSSADDNSAVLSKEFIQLQRLISFCQENARYIASIDQIWLASSELMVSNTGEKLSSIPQIPALLHDSERNEIASLLDTIKSSIYSTKCTSSQQQLASTQILRIIACIHQFPHPKRLASIITSLFLPKFNVYNAVLVMKEGVSSLSSSAEENQQELDRKSMSYERTFPCTNEMSILYTVLVKLSGKLYLHAKREDVCGQCVTIKAKYDTFQIKQRAMTLSMYLHDDNDLSTAEKIIAQEQWFPTSQVMESRWTRQQQQQQSNSEFESSLNTFWNDFRMSLSTKATDSGILQQQQQQPPWCFTLLCVAYRLLGQELRRADKERPNIQLRLAGIRISSLIAIGDVAKMASTSNSTHLIKAARQAPLGAFIMKNTSQNRQNSQPSGHPEFDSDIEDYQLATHHPLTRKSRHGVGSGMPSNTKKNGDILQQLVQSATRKKLSQQNDQHAANINHQHVQTTDLLSENSSVISKATTGVVSIPQLTKPPPTKISVTSDLFNETSQLLSPIIGGHKSIPPKRSVLDQIHSLAKRTKFNHPPPPSHNPQTTICLDLNSQDILSQSQSQLERSNESRNNHQQAKHQSPKDKAIKPEFNPAFHPSLSISAHNNVDVFSLYSQSQLDDDIDNSVLNEEQEELCLNNFGDGEPSVVPPNRTSSSTFNYEPVAVVPSIPSSNGLPQRHISMLISTSQIDTKVGITPHTVIETNTIDETDILNDTMVLSQSTVKNNTAADDGDFSITSQQNNDRTEQNVLGENITSDDYQDTHDIIDEYVLDGFFDEEETRDVFSLRATLSISKHGLVADLDDDCFDNEVNEQEEEQEEEEEVEEQQHGENSSSQNSHPDFDISMIESQSTTSSTSSIITDTMIEDNSSQYQHMEMVISPVDQFLFDMMDKSPSNIILNDILFDQEYF